MDRNVAVKLSANVAAYMSAMAKASAATKGLTSAGGDLKQLGGALQSLGKTATIGVTVPLLGLGAGAVAMAAKFDTAFAQMVGLAGVPAAEVDALKESVLALAGETAVAPQELADGLYFAASAGLDAAGAMDAVELAARASAAGMGSTQDVVGLVASAVASYGEANITAAEATDILTATIREGRAEPAELASTLGRVLPIASDLGVTFDDVGASIALLTNVFGDTNRSVTAFQGMMVKLSSPTRQGRDALADFGLTVEDIKAAISQDGLLGALELLKESGLAGSAQAMAQLFDDIEGRQGALALLNTDVSVLNETFGALDDSAGSLDTAFTAVSDTGGFKMKQALVDLQVAMIQVGDVLLPIAADIGSAISGLAGWFSDLSPTVQKVVVAIAGLAAAAGPLVFVAGSLVKNWTTLSSAFKGSTGAMGAASKALGAIGIAATVGFVGYQVFTAEQRKTDEVTRNVSGALLANMSALLLTGDAAGFAAGEIDAVAIAQEALALALGDGYEGLTSAFAAFNVSGEDMVTLLAQMDQAPVMALDNLARSFGFTAEQADRLAQTNIGSSFGASAEVLAEQIGAPIEQIEAFREALFKLQGAADNVDMNAIAQQFLDSQVTAHGLEDSLVGAAEAQAGQTRQTGDAMAVLYAWTGLMADADDETQNAILTSGEYQGALAALPPELQALVSGTEGAADATAELEDRQASAIDTTSNYQDYLSDLAHIFDEYSAGIDTALGGTRDWVRAHDGFAAALLGFNEQIEDASAGLEYNTEAGLENRDMVFGLADELIAMTKSNFDAGMSVEETTAEYKKGREALLDAAEAAGLNRDAVEELITQYGLTPELVTTSIEIANMALTQWQIDRYIEKLGTIPEEEAVRIEAAINAGDIDEAIRILNSIPDQRVVVRVGAIFQGIHMPGLDLPGFSFAHGSYIPRDMVAQLHANEVVLPLSNPDRMGELLALPQVRPPVEAAMGFVSAPTSSTGVSVAASPVGGDTYNTYSVAVHMPPGSDGDDVVRALKKYERRSGPIPISVR